MIETRAALQRAIEWAEDACSVRLPNTALFARDQEHLRTLIAAASSTLAPSADDALVADIDAWLAEKYNPDVAEAYELFRSIRARLAAPVPAIAREPTRGDAMRALARAVDAAQPAPVGAIARDCPYCVDYRFHKHSDNCPNSAKYTDAAQPAPVQGGYCTCYIECTSERDSLCPIHRTAPPDTAIGVRAIRDATQPAPVGARECLLSPDDAEFGMSEHCRDAPPAQGGADYVATTPAHIKTPSEF